MANAMDHLERQELIQKLIDNGHNELVEALLYGENKCFTKKGRCNKSGTCRTLDWKSKQLEDAFLECRKILGEDLLD
jgi:hypothetical protein